MNGIDFDIAHMLAGTLVLFSFLMLYQVRLLPLLHVLAAHAFVLAMSGAGQAYIHHAPHLYITAGTALGFKALLLPPTARPLVFPMRVHPQIETDFCIDRTTLPAL